MASPGRMLFPAALGVLLAGSAVYFAGSIAAPGLATRWELSEAQAAWLTSAVMLGFVTGTLGAVALDLPDRFRPGRLIASLLITAALFNALILIAPSYGLGLALRFLVGMSSGPVYPIVMRFLATWFPRLGTRLGILLGAYTFGLGVTAILQAVRFPWEEAVLGSSGIALLGAGVSWALLRTGPLLPVRQAVDFKAAARSFRVPAYRQSSTAYFGHMWELFALWALVPFWLVAAGFRGFALDVLVAGIFIAGALGCIAGGVGSRWIGEARVARAALSVSGLFCLLSPWLFLAPVWLIIPGVFLWGAAAVADSAMFSSLSAQAAPRTHVGAALTVQNAIGFAIPLIPLALVPVIAGWVGWQYAFVLLALGPIWGLPLVHRLVQSPPGKRGAPQEPDQSPSGGAGSLR